MAGKRRVISEGDIAYIKENYPRLTIRDIAEKLKISKSSVHLQIERLGLSKSGAIEKAEVAYVLPDGHEGEDRVSRLEKLRDLLARSIDDAPLRTLAGLSKEYREVLKEIDELKGGDGEEKNAIEAIREAIMGKM